MRIVDGVVITGRDKKNQRSKDGVELETPTKPALVELIRQKKEASAYSQKKSKNKKDASKQRRVQRILYIMQILGSEKAMAFYYGFHIQRIRVWIGAHQPPDDSLIDLMEFAIASNAERNCGFKEFVKKIRLLENIDVTEQENRHLTDRERMIKEIFIKHRENRIPLPMLYEEYGTDLVNAMKSFFNILDN